MVSTPTDCRGNSVMLVYTIDHDNLFCILENYVGIRGNALKLIKSSFSNRTQRVKLMMFVRCMAITFTRMTTNSRFHLSVRILWNH